MNLTKINPFYRNVSEPQILSHYFFFVLFCLAAKRNPVRMASAGRAKKVKAQKCFPAQCHHTTSLLRRANPHLKPLSSLNIDQHLIHNFRWEFSRIEPTQMDTDWMQYSLNQRNLRGLNPRLSARTNKYQIQLNFPPKPKVVIGSGVDGRNLFDLEAQLNKSRRR